MTRASAPFFRNLLMEPLELVKPIAAAEIAFQIKRPPRHERKLIGKFLHQ